MPGTDHVDEEIQTLRSELREHLGKDNFELYLRVIEMVVNGRLSRQEMGTHLKSLLTDQHLAEIHNRLLMLLLEKISTIEVILASKQEPTIKSATFYPQSVTLTKQERNQVTEALARKSLAPMSGDEMKKMAVLATMSLENRIGSVSQRSYSCYIRGMLLPADHLKERMIALSRAQGLAEAEQVEDSAAVYLEEAVSTYLKRNLEPSIVEKDGCTTLEPSPIMQKLLLAAGHFL